METLRPIQPLNNLKIKHIQNTIVVIDKHDMAGINYTVLIAGQFGQLIDTIYRERVKLRHNRCRNRAISTKVTFVSSGEFSTVHYVVRKFRRMGGNAAADHTLVA